MVAFTPSLVVFNGFDVDYDGGFSWPLMVLIAVLVGLESEFHLCYSGVIRVCLCLF